MRTINTYTVSKHTPGPGKCGPHSKEIYANGINIARVFPGMLGASHAANPIEAEANARLIAAAPEMYEALKEFWDKAPGGIDYAMLSRVRALLNRIED